MSNSLEGARKVLYLPGASVDRVDMVNTVGADFNRAYGQENVVFMGSPVSEVPSHPNWRGDIRKLVAESGPTGLDMILASLGATQASIALRREDPKVLERTGILENTRIQFLGPSGFTTGLRDRKRYFGEVQGLEGDVQIGLQVMGAFPVPQEQISPADLNDVLHNYSNIVRGRKISTDANTPGGFTVLPYDNNVLPNTEFFTGNEHGEFERYNDLLADAMKAGNEVEVINLITQRGAALKRPLDWLHRGAEFADKSRTGETVVPRNWKKNMLPNVGLLVQGLGSRTMHHFQDLNRRGMQADFILPPYDTLIPIETIVNFFDGDVQKAQEHTKILPLGSHPVFHAQPRIVMKAIQG